MCGQKVATVSVAEILSRIAAEIGTLEVAADDLQDAISPLILATKVKPDLVLRLQALDLMSQTLADIAAIMRILATSDCEKCTVDPVSLCRGRALSGLVNRIASRSGR